MPIGDFLSDLFNPDLAFLPKALAVAVMSSVVCGVVGCHVVLRGMAFIGDAVAHAVFPGVAIAFVVQSSLVVGGTIAGVTTAVLVAVFSQNRRVKEDAVIGVFFVAAFALGIVVISRAPGYSGSLQEFLFGSITGIPDRDLSTVGTTGLVVLGVLFVAHQQLVAVSLDREMARAMGLRVFWLDLLLYVAVTLAVVISLQTIGNILVLALLVTPAATSRLLTDRLGVMMVLSPAIGGSSALVGLYLSWSYDLAVGGTIVLVLTGAFLAAWVLAPRHGVLAKLVRQRPALWPRAAALLAVVAVAVGLAATPEPIASAASGVGAGTPPAGPVVLASTADGGLHAVVDTMVVPVAFGGSDLRWDLTAVDHEQFRSDLVRVAVDVSEGPGRLTATATSPFGESTVVVDSDRPGYPFVLQIGRAGSLRWHADRPGTYVIDVVASAPALDGGAAAARATYQLAVGGDGHDAAAPPGAGTPHGARAGAAEAEPPAASPDRSEVRAADVPSAATAPDAQDARDQAAAGGQVVIDDGHVDMGPRIVDGAWRVQLRDDTSSPAVWRDLADVVLHTPDAARIEVPDSPAYSFLGSPGTPVHVLPQVQQPGLVWPGWNTQDPSVIDAVPGDVTWRLRSVDGPGRVVLYLTGTFGDTEVLFDSAESLPQELWIGRNTHVHGNWAFTEPGVYRLTVEMTAAGGDGAQLSDTRVLTVTVGDDIDPRSAFPDGGGGDGGGGEGDGGDGSTTTTTAADMTVTADVGRPGSRSGSGQMASTGVAGLAVKVALGLGLVATGAALVAAHRRRT